MPDTRPVTIDLSRLLWRARHSTPSGIDRVELAYARHFLAQGRRTARFIARTGALGGRQFFRKELEAFLDRLEHDWTAPAGKRRQLASIGKLLAASRRAPAPGADITIIPSHQNWHRRDWLEQRRGRDGRLVLFLHDTIPYDYPEYARQGGAERHAERLENAIAVADGFIVNSAATRVSLERCPVEWGALPPVMVAPLGMDLPQRKPTKTSLPQRPFFLCLGTIEPRKNHLLLLHAWRQMAQQGGDVPDLVIAGRRGWENEQIVDLLERSRALRGHVHEYSDLGDGEIAALMRGARALLMPSFVEGYGMPVAEALACGTPVIAADLPVYREMAGAVPLYLDPLDGPGWIRAVRDYVNDASEARSAQLARLADWQAPTWDEHFAHVDNLLTRFDP